MMQKLPIKDFRWMTEEELNNLNIGMFDADGETGVIVECDLFYPGHLYESHKDFPLAPNSISITKDMLCENMQQFLVKNDIGFSKQDRLTPNFLPKYNYVVHIKNLKYYLAKGLILTKVHRAVVFTQSRWLKPYIDFNTRKRQMASSKFEKSFFKLLVNSIFGKTLENSRRYRCVKLVDNEQSAQRYISKPQFKRFMIIDSDLVCIELIKTCVQLDKPIYIGMVRDYDTVTFILGIIIWNSNQYILNKI